MIDLSQNSIESARYFLEHEANRKCPQTELPEPLRSKNWMEIVQDGFDYLNKHFGNMRLFI